MICYTVLNYGSLAYVTMQSQVNTMLLRILLPTSSSQILCSEDGESKFF